MAKKDRLFTALCVSSSAGGAAVAVLFSVLGLVKPRDLLLLAASVAVVVLHELSHVLALRLMGRRARVVPMLRRGAVAVVFSGYLSHREYALAAVAPVLAVQLPLSVLAPLSGIALVLAVLHALASVVDVAYAARFCARRCYIRVVEYGGRVIGYALKHRSGGEEVFLL